MPVTKKKKNVKMLRKTSLSKFGIEKHSYTNIHPIYRPITYSERLLIREKSSPLNFFQFHRTPLNSCQFHSIPPQFHQVVHTIPSVYSPSAYSISGYNTNTSIWHRISKLVTQVKLLSVYYLYPCMCVFFLFFVT